MGEEASHSRSGILFLMVGFCIAALGAVFALVPLVECHRCDENGQFATEQVLSGRQAIDIDYCDCASFFELMKSGKRGRISLLRALRQPRSLIIDSHGTGRGYTP